MSDPGGAAGADMPNQNVLDRRPIRSRRLKVIQNLAAFLAARRVSPNVISIVGMLAAIGAGVAIGLSRDASDLTARVLLGAGAVLIQARLLANLLDGMVAVEGGLRSPVGELYNEVPDRISDMAVLIGAGYAAGSFPALGYVAAALAVFVAYIRAMGRASGFPGDYRGPMAKQERMFIVTISALYLALAPADWRPSVSIADGTGNAGLFAGALALIVLGCVVTALRRLLRLAANLRTRGL